MQVPTTRFSVDRDDICRKRRRALHRQGYTLRFPPDPARGEGFWFANVNRSRSDGILPDRFRGRLLARSWSPCWPSSKPSSSVVSREQENTSP
jgi:hypothetical protein